MAQATHQPPRSTEPPASAQAPTTTGAGATLPITLAGAVAGSVVGVLAARALESSSAAGFFPVAISVGALLGGLGGALLATRRALLAARAEAEAARQQTDATVERDRAFFERLSQEFRTPLTLILAGFRALQDERDAPARVRREVASAGLRNAARLLLVLYEMGALASMEPGQRTIRKRTVDLAALTRRVAGNFSASGAGRRLELIGVDAPLMVDIDPHQIQTVLYTLLAGAFERTDPVSGHVRVSLRVTGPRVSLELQDNGGPAGPEPGLDPTVTSRGGPGLGLAVVREIVGAHQGTVELSSKPDGLLLRLLLPRGEAAGTPGELLDERAELQDFLHRLSRPALPDEDAPTEEAGPPLDPTRALVMVVLGNADLRAWLKRVLSERYAVITASDLPGASARAATARPDLLVTDADPPDEGSVSLVAAIRRDPVLCGTPLLGLISRTVPRDSIDPDRLAADDYLPLPFEADELLARVGNLVRSRNQADENATLRRQLEARIEDQIHELIRKGELRRYLPQALLEGSLRRPAEDDEDEDSGASELDRRWLTVVHCSLRGFGDLAERMDPGDLLRLLNTWAREAAAEASLRGGVVDQHSGDSLVIFFGAPESMRPPDQAIAALEVALAIRDRTRALAEHWHRFGLPRELDLRTGVHTGVALVGVLGSELTSRYTAFGPAVRVAAVLAAEPSNPDLLISLATFAHVRARIDASQVGTVSVDGLSRPVELYAVRGWKDGARP